MENKKRLCDIKGLGEAKIDKMVDAANKIEHAGYIPIIEYNLRFLIKRSFMTGV